MVMAPTLVNMPVELFEMVCYAAASTRSLKALRSTSHHMHEKTERVFADRTFTNIELSLHEEKLMYLQQVAGHPKYSDLVRFICLVPSYTFLTSEQNRFRKDRGDIELLSEALPMLQNLKGVQVGRQLEVRERQATMHSLMVLGHASRSDGLGVLTTTDYEHRSGISFLAHGFHALISALNMSGKQLDIIRAGFQPYDKNSRNSIDHLALQLPSIDKLQNSLTSLKQLDLVVEVRAGHTSDHCETYLSDLLEQTPNLQSLSLSFPDTACAWLATLPDVYLPSLTSLTINKAHQVSATELWDFIARHKTLKILRLTLLQFRESDPFKGMAECLRGLELNEIHLQQLTCLHQYNKIMVFGYDLTKFCTTCYDDVEAAFHYVQGPRCEHTTISVKGEHELNAALENRLRECHLLTRLHPGWARWS